MPRIPAHRFTHALCRRPGAAVARGLRGQDTGDPDPEVFAREHAHYVEALRMAGVAVMVLPPDEAHADAVFVEDPCLCLSGVAILLRPGTPERFGEVETLRAPVEAAFAHVRTLPGPGFVDGGDIMVTDREVLIGLSGRTDRAGAEALSALLSDLDYRARIVTPPPGVLHLKTHCAPLGSETVLATRQLAESGVLDGYDIVPVPPGEEPAANALRINNRVFVAAGYPRTAERIAGFGHDVTPLALSQAAKVDGGLSCLSLRWHAE